MAIKEKKTLIFDTQEKRLKIQKKKKLNQL